MSAREQATVDQHPATFASLVERVKWMICEETASILSATYGSDMEALVLTGSLSRNEPAILLDNSTIRVLGDADFILVFKDHSILPNENRLPSLCGQIRTELLKRGVRCEVGLSLVHPVFFRRLKPTIFTYELLTCGSCVWGDPTILSLIPTQSPYDIPLEDAWRTLCNRMIELLEVQSADSAQPVQMSLGLQYRVVKLWLDMATSLLIFAGCYAPTYAERERNLRTLTRINAPADYWPFSLTEFSSMVSSATEWRTSDVPGCTPFAEWRQFGEAVRYARALWRWELCWLTGLPNGTSDRQLWHTWLRKSPVHTNVRGWLYILRKRGWHKSMSQWPHWLRLGLRGSPRYWIYGVASELFFHIRRQPGREDSDSDTGRSLNLFHGWLPEVRAANSAASEDWRLLAADVVRNYTEFLIDTRS